MKFFIDIFEKHEIYVENIELELKAIRINLLFIQNLLNKAYADPRDNLESIKEAEELYTIARASYYLEQYLNKLTREELDLIRNNNEEAKAVLTAAILLAIKADYDVVGRDKQYIDILNKYGCNIDKSKVLSAQLSILKKMDYCLDLQGEKIKKITKDKYKLSKQAVMITGTHNKKLIILEDTFLEAAQKANKGEKIGHLKPLLENKIIMQQGSIMRNLRKLSPIFACSAEKAVNNAIKDLEKAEDGKEIKVTYRGRRFSV